LNVRSFGVDLGGSSLADARRKVLDDFSAEERKRLAVDVVADSLVISPDAKVSCPYGDACTSPSRRDQTKSKAWLCGSSFSHKDRLCGCITYCRFERFLKDGQTANRRPSR
jgi:hypothetical protein